MYRVREFASRTGVTVRALHHYDRLRLLKPLRNVRTGHRVYRDGDVARLEQIVVLKFLGIPLRERAPLLKTANPHRLLEVLRKQRHVLSPKRSRLDAAAAAIERAEHALAVHASPMGSSSRRCRPDERSGRRSFKSARPERTRRLRTNAGRYANNLTQGHCA